MELQAEISGEFQESLIGEELKMIVDEIDPESGLLATSGCPQTYVEAFPEELVPTEPCPLHPSHPLVDTVRKGFRGLGEFFRNLFR